MRGPGLTLDTARSGRGLVPNLEPVTALACVRLTLSARRGSGEGRAGFACWSVAHRAVEVRASLSELRLCRVPRSCSLWGYTVPQVNGRGAVTGYLRGFRERTFRFRDDRRLALDRTALLRDAGTGGRRSPHAGPRRGAATPRPGRRGPGRRGVHGAALLAPSICAPAARARALAL